MPLKIYYLDDEPAILEMFSDTFSSPEREIVTFSDPNLAIERIQADPPDILFIDYRLPNIMGDELAKKLDPKIPKVLITGDFQLNVSYPFFAILEKLQLRKSASVEALFEQIARSQNTG